MTSIKVWVLLLLVDVSIAIRVYVHPAPANVVRLPPVLSPTQARAVVSQQLGLDAFDPLDEVDSKVVNLVTDSSFVGKGSRNAMLLTVGEDVLREIIPASLKSSFSISNPPSAASEVSLVVSSYLQRASHVYTNIYSATSSHPVQPVPRLLDTFSASFSSATEEFLSETAQLVSIIEEEENDSFGAFELKGVSAIAAEYGRQSEQFKLAVETSRALFESAMAHPKLSFVVLSYPTTQSHTKRQQALQPPQSPLPPPLPSPQLPIGGVSTCHESADTCSNATEACSGHGACVQASKAGKTCFVCSCNITHDASGRRDYWAGDSCQKKDISAPFTLITGTVIAVLLIVIGSVSLLYSIGDQQLPNLLTAGASGHIKRD